ncbi:hypothetical protein DRO22_03715 [Candidatus Bathyarchaeota archaeon]|nr:MAG: hypothetical protein DRO22_03715 [Candidatus Bathyarchaeota archaeon]
MPSNSIDFLYSFLALSMVGMILTAALNSYGGTLKQTSESKQLEVLLERVESKATYALLLLTENNATLVLSFQMPPKIGDRYYWIRIANDSSSSWVEGGFGIESRTGEQEYRVYLPRKIYASGTFESRYMIAQLNCSLAGSTPKIVLGRRE